MNRSGSTWSYQVCKEILKNQVVFDMGFVQEGKLNEVIEKMDLDSYGYLLIKMHKYDPYLQTLTKQHDIKSIYTHRDLRGCLYSLMKKTGKPFDEFFTAKFFVESVESLSNWNELNSILYIDYSDITEKGEQSTNAIAEFLKLNSNSKKIAQLFTRENQAKRLREYKATPAGFIKNLLVQFKVLPFANQKDTLLHTNHLNSQTVDEWKNTITVSQSEQVQHKFKDWMSFFNYT